MRLGRAWMVVVSLLAACRRDESKAGPPPAPRPEPVLTEPVAPTAADLGVDSLGRFVPSTLRGLTRKHREDIPEVDVATAMYGDGTTEVHLNLGHASDGEQAKSFYAGNYPVPLVVAGMRAYGRAYVEDSGRQTSEACILLRTAINVCVGLAPSTDAHEAAQYLEGIDLAGLVALAQRAGVPHGLGGDLTFQTDEAGWALVEERLRAGRAGEEAAACQGPDAEHKPECAQIVKSRGECAGGDFEGLLRESDIHLTAAERANFRRLWVINCKIIGAPPPR